MEVAMAVEEAVILVVRIHITFDQAWNLEGNIGRVLSRLYYR